MRTHQCPDCHEWVTYQDDDRYEHGHAPGCEGAQVCDCAPGWMHEPTCPLVANEGGGRMNTGPCDCGHLLYLHAIRHKPSQDAKGYLYGDNYMILGCTAGGCPCPQFKPKSETETASCDCRANDWVEGDEGAIRCTQCGGYTGEPGTSIRIVPASDAHEGA